VSGPEGEAGSSVQKPRDVALARLHRGLIKEFEWSRGRPAGRWEKRCLELRADRILFFMERDEG
jgi:hypothetical protein